MGPDTLHGGGGYEGVQHDVRALQRMQKKAGAIGEGLQRGVRKAGASFEGGALRTPSACERLALPGQVAARRA